MNYWEDFFSLDKIIYPSMGCILMGVFYFIFAYILNLQFDDILFYIFTGSGFLLGNIIKVKNIQKIREQEKRNKKKSRKT